MTSARWDARRRRYAVSVPTLHVDVVEDHAGLREGLAAWLEYNTEGIRVVGRFSSWSELVPRLDDLSDVVVLDVLLPDNIPLGAKIRAILSAGQQVVVCSSVTTPAVMRHAFEAGALSYVPKTASITVLEAALRSAARGQAYIIDEVATAMALENQGPQLSPREHHVVTLYLGGHRATQAEIAHSLGISVSGVKKHLVSIRRKFQDDDKRLTRTALKARLVADGWLPDEPSLVSPIRVLDAPVNQPKRLIKN